MNRKIVFQSLMEVSIENKGKFYDHLSLSDPGSTGSFLVKQYAEHIGLEPSGRWTGSLTTLMGSTRYSCNFYKMVFRVHKSDTNLPKKVISWALETPRIGSRVALPSDVLRHLCAFFRCQQSEISSRAGNFGSLLGLDMQGFLLKEVTHIDSKPIVYPTHLVNISLQWSPLSKLLSLVGSLGNDASMPKDPETFGIKEISGNFAFFQQPTREECSSIKKQYKMASLSTCQPVLPPPTVLPNSPRMGSCPAGTPAFSSGGAGSYSSGHASGPTTPSSGGAGSYSSGHASGPMSSSPSGPTSSPSTGTPALYTSPPPKLARPRARIPLFPHPALLMILFTMGICLPTPKTKEFYPLLLHPRGWSGQVLSYSNNKEAPHHPSSVVQLLRRHPKSTFLWLSQLQCLQSSGNLDPLAADDPHSLSLQLLFPCPDCRRRMLSCPSCKSKNSPLSETEKLENKRILESIKIITVNGQDRVLFDYPFNCVFSEKFKPELSNYAAALQTSKNLFKKLHSKGLAAQFHEEIMKGIKDDHLELLSPEQTKIELTKPHSFSFLNFTQKMSAKGHSIRPVSNTSSNHPSGSANSWLPRGSAILGDLVSIFESFRLFSWVLISDISRCYRSIISTDQSNRARLHLYPLQPLNPLCTQYIIMKYKCATYGDACIATLLEMIMLHFVAPRIDDKLGKELALVKRYVDDIIGSGDDRDKLVVAMLSLERALNSLGFTLKKIISNNFWHFSIPNLNSLGAAWQPEPNPESTPEEVIFGHQWSIKSDTLRPNFKLYTGKKSRGTYTGDVLEKTHLKNVVITKRLMASLCAQIFELDGCWSSILKTHFKILF